MTVGVVAAALLAAAARGQGGFMEIHESVPRSAETVLMLAADFDGDGVVDLLRSDGVLRNDGSGRFPASGFAPSVLFGFATRVVAADFDLDGDLDVARLDGWNTSPKIALNVGAGAFLSGPTLSYPAPGQRREVLVAGDVNGDGRPDLLGATHDPVLGAVVVVVWTNLGGMTFLSSSFQAGSTAAEPVAAADVNGDGRDEVLLNDYGATGQSSLRLAAWSAGGWSVGPVLVGPSFYMGAILADWNADGFADLLTWRAPFATAITPPTTVTETLALGSNVGLLPPATRVATGFPDRVLRIERDGTPPCEMLRESGQQSSIQSVPGAAPAPTVSVPLLPGDPSATLVADFDGDGDDDVLGMTSSGAPRLAFNAGGALVEPDGALPSRFSAARRTTLVADVDGDGLFDLLAGDFAQVARNDGTGAFTVVSATPPAGLPALPAPAVVADFDGDGREDVFAAYGDVPPRAFLAGPGPALTSVAAPQLGVPARAVVAGDADGDGDPDVFVVAADPPRLEFFRNGGASWTKTTLDVVRRVRDVAPVDLDGDGDLDLVAACRSASSPFVVDPCVFYVNDGSGAFVVQAAPFVVEADAVTTGDADGDGDRDLVLDGALYARGLGGTFVRGAGVAVDPAGFLGAALADVDGDGLAELCGPSGVAAGLGSGGFGAATPWPAPMLAIPSPFLGAALTSRLRPVDFDRDGDLDVAASVPAIATNASRQLRRATHARPGRPGILALEGPPGSPYVIYYSAGRLAPAIDLGPWGLLHLDPATAGSFFVGAFDGLGRAESGFVLPNVPSLVGLSLWWQAVLPIEAKLTDAVVTTVLGF